MIYTIESDLLQVKIKSAGAELCSIINKQNGLDYLWQAGKEWPKHSPVLFPVVGQLKDNKYIFENKEYYLERHGFARTSIFNAGMVDKLNAEFFLNSNAETLKIYPFRFQLKIKYSISQNKLIVNYTVENKSRGSMYFSIGAHPAFKIPLIQSQAYDDYFLEFNKPENASRCILKNGLISNEQMPVLKNSNILPLTKKLFCDDALVFKNLLSDCITIKNNKSSHGLHFRFSGFPYFGIWSAKDADFICLEPWHGIADGINHNGQLKEKEGILNLDAGKKFSCVYSIEPF